MVGSLGATLSGVTFPAPFMYEPVYYASFLFPVRHFVEISQNLLYGDYGFAYTWQNVARTVAVRAAGAAGAASLEKSRFKPSL